jgi:hypothetical protein
VGPPSRFCCGDSTIAVSLIADAPTRDGLLDDAEGYGRALAGHAAGAREGSELVAAGLELSPAQAAGEVEAVAPGYVAVGEASDADIAGAAFAMHAPVRLDADAALGLDSCLSFEHREGRYRRLGVGVADRGAGLWICQAVGLLSPSPKSARRQQWFIGRGGRSVSARR